MLYLACTTRDNVLILSELCLTSNDQLYGKLKYKSQNKVRETDFENYLTLVLSQSDQSLSEDAICR